MEGLWNKVMELTQMFQWGMVGNVLVLFYGLCFLASLVVCGMMFLPKYIVYLFYW